MSSTSKTSSFRPTASPLPSLPAAPSAAPPHTPPVQPGVAHGDDFVVDTATVPSTAVSSPATTSAKSVPAQLEPPPVGFRYVREPKVPGQPNSETRGFKLVPARASGSLESALDAFASRLSQEKSVGANELHVLLSLVASEFTPASAVERLGTIFAEKKAHFSDEAKATMEGFLSSGGTSQVEAMKATVAKNKAEAQKTGGVSGAAASKAPAKVTKTDKKAFVPGVAWRGGMGAIPHDGGTTFRLWAPNAQRVQVIGDFNNWNLNDARELWREDGSGNWSGFVPNAGDGQRYKYVIQGKHGDWRWKNDPRSARVTNSTGDSVIYDHAAYKWQNDGKFRMPDWNEAVIYQMHFGTFHDSPGFGPGTYASAIDRLDHLQWLGVNVVKLMPAAEFPGDFSQGYNPAFPFAPESAYGHPDDLKRFVDEAHKRGIGVMMDVVHNHWGPNDLPHWDLDGETWGHGGEYFYTDWRANTPWGATKPDFGRHEVREYIKDNGLMWLRDYRMDGLRWDAFNHIRSNNGADNPDGWSFARDFNAAVDREFPWKLNVAEDMQQNAGVTHPWGAAFDSQWDAGFVHPIRESVIEPNDSSRDMGKVARAVSHTYNGEATQRVIFAESHDEVSFSNGKKRIVSEVGGWDAGGWQARKRATLATSLTMTSPGIPMLHQGQEFVEPQQFEDTKPINWENSYAFDGIKNLTQALIKLRRNWNNNTQGLKGNHVNTFHQNDVDKVLGYHRWDKGGPGDDVVVIANMSGRTYHNYRIGLPTDGQWKVRFNSDWNGFSSDFGATPVFDVGGQWGGYDNMPANGALNLPPYTVVILSRDR